MGKKFLLAVPVLMFLLFLSAGPVAATEGGLYQYPDGIDDFMMGALPPPGVYFLNYAVYANISDYEDIRAPETTDKLKYLGLGKPKIKGWTVIDAVRLIYVSKCKVLGGDFALHVIQPFQHVEYTKATLGPVQIMDDFPHPDNGTVNTKTGLKNTIVGAAVGWHFSKNLHAAGILDVAMPTGSYSRDDLANPGTPYWTFTPMFIVTYLADSGFEVGAKLMYDINTKNKESGYLSGQVFHADYIIGQHMGPWMFGINGYYVAQLTNDKARYELTGTDGGNKAGAFAVGPAVAYNYKNMFFKAKVQFDVYEKNRPETQRYWFNYIYCF